MEILKLYLDYFVFGILGFMSFLMLTFAIERLIYYARIKSKLISFQNIHELEIALTNNLTTISTIGANAPYVGLLGTVLGIMITFYDIGQGGKIDANTVMLGLALALKATAAGLLVAIPSIMFYNGLLRKVEVLKSLWLQLPENNSQTP
ncbi:TonB-system energizer ExbB [Thiotrichales bacterium HSG1]|nr:TonB-system energizer ExbB [Thiotrichales bacterium HSG1]